MKKLTDLQYAVTQLCQTEPPFQNEFWNHKEPGLYLDIVTGEPLFASVHKFDSGSGWPSFTRPIEGGRVLEFEDFSHGMQRIEVKSKGGKSHLGHVFNDGPRSEGGLRYCINSASLRFVHVDDLEKEGLGTYRSLFDSAKVSK